MISFIVTVYLISLPSYYDLFIKQKTDMWPWPRSLWRTDNT